MKYIFTTSGTCSKQIEISVDKDTQTIEDVCFVGGCPGNTVGVATLVRGRQIDDVISLLEGIPCGTKRTSCPDQLAQALKSIKSDL